MKSASVPARLSMSQVLLCGAMIVTLSMGIRHGFGLWLQPITMDRGWSRETFAFALAIQNLAWGIAGPQRSRSSRERPRSRSRSSPRGSAT